MSLERLRVTRRDWIRRMLVAGSLATAPRRALALQDDLTVPNVLLALRTARRTGRPLLVLQVTSHRPRSHARMFSTFLNGATPRRLAMLTLVDPICCELSALRLAMGMDGMPEASMPADAVMLWLFTPSLDGTTFEIQRFESPESWFERSEASPNPYSTYADEYERRSARERAVESILCENDERIAAFLERSLGQDPSPRDESADCRSQQLVDLARSRMSRREIEIATTRSRDFKRLKASYLKRWSPILLERVRSEPLEVGNAILLALGAVARNEWVIDAPAGAIWSIDVKGCAVPRFEQFTHIESDEPVTSACGIAYTPERESRFLVALTAGDFGLIRPRVPSDVRRYARRSDTKR